MDSQRIMSEDDKKQAYFSDDLWEVSKQVSD